MWYLIKVFKNKMRHTARKRRGKYMTLETGIRGEQSVLVTPNAWFHRPRSRRFSESLMRLFSPLL